MNNQERITIAGFGGQGVMLIGQLLAYAAVEENKNSLWFPSYGPETRGGTANCAVTISDIYINSPVFSKANTLIALNLPSLNRFKDKVIANGIIIYNSSLIKEINLNTNANVFAIPANDLAIQLGNSRVANMIVLGSYLQITNLFKDDIIIKVLKELFGKEKENLISINEEALKVGRNYIKEKYIKTAI